MYKFFKSNFLVTVFVSFGFLAALYLVGRNQEGRPEASFVGGFMSLTSASGADLRVGDEFELEINGTVETGVQVNLATTRICFGSQIRLWNEVDLFNNVILGPDFVELSKLEKEGNCLKMVLSADGDGLEWGNESHLIARVRFKAISVGNGTITIDPVASSMAGMKGGDNYLISINGVLDLDYKVEEGILVEFKDQIDEDGNLKLYYGFSNGSGQNIGPAWIMFVERESRRRFPIGWASHFTGDGGSGFTGLAGSVSSLLPEQKYERIYLTPGKEYCIEVYQGDREEPDLDRILAKGCHQMIKNAIDWKNDFFSIRADNFYIETDNGRVFLDKTPRGRMNSDPFNGGDPDYTTFEREWMERDREKFVEMRLNVYIKKEGSAWQVTEIRTYDGQERGNWVYFDEDNLVKIPKLKMGDVYNADFELESDKNEFGYWSKIHVEGGSLELYRPAVPLLIPKELKFKFTYAGVSKDNQSADDWKISVIVMDKMGKKQVFENVVPEKISQISSVRNLQLRTYQAKLVLSEEFVNHESLAVFINGPKHIQTKYGKDKQNSFYNLQGGDIDVLLLDKIYDFSAYPLLAGDLTGGVGGGRDGVIDGRDFAFVKIEASRNGNKMADLNADGKVNSADTTTLLQSLEERQAQLY